MPHQRHSTRRKAVTYRIRHPSPRAADVHPEFGPSPAGFGADRHMAQLRA